MARPIVMQVLPSRSWSSAAGTGPGGALTQTGSATDPGDVGGEGIAHRRVLIAALPGAVPAER